MKRNSRYEKLFREEKGRINKPFGLRCNIALVFPDRYEPAMSNLGFQTVYRYLNSFADINCERFFYDKDIPLSFENRRKLHEFDVIALSIPFEPLFVSAMMFLYSHGIPIDRSHRSNSHPLIIAGGIATCINPGPLEGCIDYIIPGDIEDTGSLLIESLLQGSNTNERLDNITMLMADKTGFTRPKSGRECVARHSQIITPHTTLRDKLLIEVTRGCPYRCTFCFIGNQSLPFQQASWNCVRDILLQHETRNLGIISSAVGSWKGLDEFISYAFEQRYRVSFSSLRMDEIKDSVLDILHYSGQQSLTLAPETGDEELRFSLNKNIVNEKIFSIVEKAFYKGLQQVKLYIMVGLPGESMKTMESTLLFFHKLDILVKDCSRISGKAKKILVKMGIFVPKPMTTLADTPLMDETALKNIFEYYRDNQKHFTSLSFNYDSIRSYYLQFLLSNYHGSLMSFFQEWCAGNRSQKSLINEYLGRLSHV